MDPPATQPDDSPGEGARGWFAASVWLGMVLAVGGLLFTYHHLDVVASGGSRSASKSLINELTAAFGAGLLYFGVRALVRRHSLAQRWWPRVLLYALALAMFAVAHTSFMWASRHFLYPALGQGTFNYGRMPLRYAMELPMQSIAFTVMVAAVHALERIRTSQRRELDTARLEHRLTQARLRYLQLQLQPHFLFNALNAISSTMYRDVKEADTMIERLADLLRASLRAPETGEVALDDELEALRCYLDVARSRFGARLCVDIDVPDDLLRATVPVTVLQPLVENAIRHGGVEIHGRGRVTVRARRRDDRLCLEVTDDGPGAPESIDPLTQGVGLGATAERLRLLYPGRHEFVAHNLPEGGFRVAMTVPFSVREEQA